MDQNKLIWNNFSYPCLGGALTLYGSVFEKGSLDVVRVHSCGIAEEAFSFDSLKGH